MIYTVVSECIRTRAYNDLTWRNLQLSENAFDLIVVSYVLLTVINTNLCAIQPLVFDFSHIGNLCNKCRDRCAVTANQVSIHRISIDTVRFGIVCPLIALGSYLNGTWRDLQHTGGGLTNIVVARHIFAAVHNGEGKYILAFSHIGNARTFGDNLMCIQKAEITVIFKHVEAQRITVVGFTISERLTTNDKSVDLKLTKIVIIDRDHIVVSHVDSVLQHADLFFFIIGVDDLGNHAVDVFYIDEASCDHRTIYLMTC